MSCPVPSGRGVHRWGSWLAHSNHNSNPLLVVGVRECIHDTVPAKETQKNAGNLLVLTDGHRRAHFLLRDELHPPPTPKFICCSPNLQDVRM